MSPTTAVMNCHPPPPVGWTDRLCGPGERASPSTVQSVTSALYHRPVANVFVDLEVAMNQLQEVSVRLVECSSPPLPFDVPLNSVPKVVSASPALYRAVSQHSKEGATEQAREQKALNR